MGLGNGKGEKGEERWKEVEMEGVNGKESRMKGNTGIVFWTF